MKDNQAKYPQLRFKGFTDPWEERKLGDIAPLRGGFAFKSSKFRNTGVPIVRISNILSSGEVGGDFAYYDEQDKDDKYILPDKSAVLAMSGATTGKVSILSQTDYDKVYQNQRVGYFQSVDYIDYGFISTIVRSELFMMQLESVLVSGAQPNVSSKEIDSFNFMIPILVQEQQQIGSFFKQLDETIALHQRKLAKLKELKQGYLQKMFPQNGSKFPQLRFAGFADDWEQRKLGDITKISTGKLDANAMVENGKYDFYTSGIKKYRIDVAAFEGPSITIAGNGATVGYMHLADNKFNAYQRTYVLQEFLVDRSFIFSEIGNKLPKKIKQEARTGNIPYIVMDMLTELKLSIPQNNSEQQKIGSFFRQLDDTIDLHQRKLDLLKEQKKGFLQNMSPVYNSSATP